VIAAALVLLQAASPSPPPTAVTVSRGSITPRIVAASDPRFSYALYLPKEYSPAREWPVLYVFDPRGRGVFGADLFAEAAAAHGFVVASSNDTRSDDPKAPNADAVSAVWADTHSRLRLDPKRRYLAGFSGTARLAARIALVPQSGIAGVIAIGGRFADDVRGKDPWPFPLWGAAGDDDFNHPEMWRLDDLLAKNGTPHRITFFDGAHEWIPKPMAMEALDWFAVRDAARPAVPAVVDRYRAAVVARATALEAAGRTGEALREWKGLAEDIPAQAAAAAEQVARLGDAARRDLDKVRKQAERDRGWIDGVNDRSAALLRDPVLPLAALVRHFEVDSLRRQAASANPVLAHSARRRLAMVAATAGFYVPEQLKSEGQFAAAVRWQELAAAVDPDAPGPHLFLARTYARSGNRKAALDALRAAADRGLRLPRPRLAEDPELASLAGDPVFERILEALPPS
jgi:predicted esterase